MAGVGGAGGPHWSCASVPAREIQHETAPGVAGRASRARAWRGGQGGGGVRRVWQHTLVAASSRTRCSEWAPGNLSVVKAMRLHRAGSRTGVARRN